MGRLDGNRYSSEGKPSRINGLFAFEWLSEVRQHWNYTQTGCWYLLWREFEYAPEPVRYHYVWCESYEWADAYWDEHFLHTPVAESIKT